MREPEGFQEYVRGRQRSLLRSAYLITGDPHLAHDLVQSALVRAWPRWERISRLENVDGYVYRVLVTTWTSWKRRRWHGEIPHGQVPDGAAVADPQDTSAERVTVAEALRALPPRQRAVVVLRFYADLTEAQTAEAMGCSVGTVKSQTAKALAALRRSAAAMTVERSGEAT
ncbi:SigE family RNA polymerase sigma factor [Kitasatospora kifunensis]|uniref:RNA polymerase sigma-70 factor (Sigma-E family) n=1 Tax=Kitasatospora kifunensis TaxID=58351 RepID=A0A7W7R079_KITKI|nr:SigE family RNA polymerase sigma factor [Kitasatospora kifunensis]MBB4922406.1 RNA polymerase sigma-70 factor (sigma-E family) [Kitasatospora kifunensis]